MLALMRLDSNIRLQQECRTTACLTNRVRLDLDEKKKTILKIGNSDITLANKLIDLSFSPFNLL